MALKRRAHTRPLSHSGFLVKSARTQRVGRSWWCALKGLGVGLPGAAISADLGGSSKYFGEAPKDRCGEGFRVNSR
jgi:hypothetical protein